MTVGECASRILGDATYDTAVPQGWLDHIVKTVLCEDYHRVLSAFVWAYDDPFRHGRPCALTGQANSWLKTINATMGTEWPLTPIEDLARAWGNEPTPA